MYNLRSSYVLDHFTSLYMQTYIYFTFILQFKSLLHFTHYTAQTQKKTKVGDLIIQSDFSAIMETK